MVAGLNYDLFFKFSVCFSVVKVIGSGWEAVVWALYADITFLYFGFLVMIAFIEFHEWTQLLPSWGEKIKTREEGTG